MRVSAAPAFSNRSSNPYNALLFGALVARGVEVVEFDPTAVIAQRPDLVHLHWPESPLNKPRRSAAAYRSLELLVVLARLRRRGVRVIWTTHNLRSHFHRYPRAETLWWKLFLPLLSGWLSLSEGAAEAARQAHPRLRRLPVAVVPHGHYRDAYPDADRGTARAGLGLTDQQRLVLFLGRVKPYKGVPELLTVFQQLDDPALRLLIAGRCDEAVLATELRAAVSDPRVTLHLEEVPEDQVAPLLRAADLVVLPFRSVLNSGSALLALSFDVPVLCPRRGALGEIASAVPGWVTTYDGELTPEVLRTALDRPRLAGQPDLSAFGWDEIARRTEDFYTSLLSGHEALR